MLARIFFFLIGFGFTIIGSIYIISYLNILTIGYNFLEYVKFISSRIECLFTVIGLFIIFLTIFIKGGPKDELYLRYINQLK